MANCDDLFTQLDRIATALEKQNAIVAGEPAEELDGEGQPVYDYSESGLVPSLVDALHIDRLIYADKNIAEVLFEGLVGRKLGGLPLPFEGKGLADIADEQLQELHNRFRQFDLSFPGGLEKNITETLETLLRTDKITDLEFITPNLVTILNQVFKLEDDNPLSILVGELYAWLIGEPAPELPEYNTIAELLLLIARARLEAETSPAGLTTAINTLTTSLAGDLETIGDNITAQTVVIETRSGAEVVAQTTNFNNLIAGLSSLAARVSPDDASNLYAAIQALELTADLTCSPDVNVSVDPIINVTCESGLGGTEPPAEEGTEGGSPPAGFEDPPADPGYDRKCRVANMIIDGHISVLDQFITHDVVGLAELGIAIVSASISYIFSLPGAAALAALKEQLGAVAELISTLIGGGINLVSLKAIFEANREDLVCGLYTSTTTTQAQQSILDILSAQGASTSEILLCSIMFTSAGANNLFFSGGSISEAMLDGYTGTINCEVCGVQATPPVLNHGTITDGSLYGPTVRVRSQTAGTVQRIDIVWPDGATVQCTSTENWASPYQNPNVRIWDTSDTIVYSNTSGLIPTETYQNTSRFFLGDERLGDVFYASFNITYPE